MTTIKEMIKKTFESYKGAGSTGFVLSELVDALDRIEVKQKKHRQKEANKFTEIVFRELKQELIERGFEGGAL